MNTRFILSEVIKCKGSCVLSKELLTAVSTDKDSECNCPLNNTCSELYNKYDGISGSDLFLEKKAKAAKELYLKLHSLEELMEDLL